MSERQYFVYVFAPKDAVLAPAKIGITRDPKQRKHKINRHMRSAFELRTLPPGDYRWMAKVPNEAAALMVEKRVKSTIGRRFYHMNDWIAASPEAVATVANFIVGSLRT
jgi:predicted GIY-YIG superfamily endonuclease